MKYNLSVGEIRQRITAKLLHNLSVTPTEATVEQLYTAIAEMVRDLLQKSRTDFMAKAGQQGTKQVYYLCMEFLMGRSLKNNLYNLGLTDAVASALQEIGVSLDKIFECEPDAGLGNGGLGRLAALLFRRPRHAGLPCCRLFSAI